MIFQPSNGFLVSLVKFRTELLTRINCYYGWSIRYRSYISLSFCWMCLLNVIELFCYTGVQIVDICLSTRPHNGGLISLQELCTLLRQRRKSDREAVSEDDCLRAISKLKVLR